MTTKSTAPPAASATYTAELTAAQIFGFADLVRRMNQAYGPDADRFIRQDLADALFAFLQLTPEPTDEDGDAYLAAVRAGELPNWGMDDQPLTETTGEWAARVRARAAAGNAPAAAPGAGVATCTAELTAAQIFGFADLVHRLGTRTCRQDCERHLRQDLTDALSAFLQLLPEPSDADRDAYLAAVRAGDLPNWATDDQPLTETTGEWAARVRARLAAA